MPGTSLQQRSSGSSEKATFHWKINGWADIQTNKELVDQQSFEFKMGRSIGIHSKWLAYLEVDQLEKPWVGVNLEILDAPDAFEEVDVVFLANLGFGDITKFQKKPAKNDQTDNAGCYYLFPQTENSVLFVDSAGALNMTLSVTLYNPNYSPADWITVKGNGKVAPLSREATYPTMEEQMLEIPKEIVAKNQKQQEASKSQMEVTEDGTAGVSKSSAREAASKSGKKRTSGSKMDGTSKSGIENPSKSRVELSAGTLEEESLASGSRMDAPGSSAGGKVDASKSRVEVNSENEIKGSSGSQSRMAFKKPKKQSTETSK